jgi:DNA-directed RNA polymerase subunit RPC12/RpoP
MAQATAEKTISASESRMYRRARLVGLASVLCLLFSLIAIPPKSQYDLSLFVVIGCFGVLVISVAYTGSWKCPRCGRTFERLNWYSQPRLFGSDCAHCGARL